MKVTVRMTGLRELDHALGELPKATGRAVLRRALVKAAQPIADEARRLVPVDRGDLKRSIKVGKPRGGSAGRSAFAAAMRGGASRAEAGAAAREANRAASSGGYSAELDVGAGQLPHAHMVEFGTSKMAAQPYMRPAFDSRKRPAAEAIRRELKTEIEKARKRLARKAEREAAKIRAGL